MYFGVNTLHKIIMRNKKIYLLSNAQQIFTEYEMKHLGIYDYFDGICFSSDESCKKPSKTFYGILFDRYNLKKEESVMIGNDWISDIEGAKNFGIDSVYLHTNISPWDTVLEEVQADIIIEDGDLYKLSQLIK
jgi:putative hydrolase of the HAD superfamily